MLASSSSIAKKVLLTSTKLRDAVSALDFAEPVTHVYNPLEYAWDLHAAYIRKYGGTKKRVLMLGMNPGPWGMAQTGVPFGEVAVVKGWLDLKGKISKPTGEHPKRPVLGLDSQRSEVSGRRLWGFFSEKFANPEDFFAEHIVVNYCPLVFMEESARNRTPDKLPVSETVPLFAACDARLMDLVDIYQPEWVVGVGGFARKKLDSLYKKYDGPRHCPANIGTVLHPSPASPAANRGWAEAAEKQLLAQGIWL